MKKKYMDFLCHYVVNHLSELECEIKNAIDYMDRYRCPLSSASETIVSAIDDAVRDFCDDCEYDYYNFDVELVFDRDLETIFFDALTEMDYYDSPDAEYDE